LEVKRYILINVRSALYIFLGRCHGNGGFCEFPGVSEGGAFYIAGPGLPEE
jgi:hypothetical protein